MRRISKPMKYFLCVFSTYALLITAPVYCFSEICVDKPTFFNELLLDNESDNSGGHYWDDKELTAKMKGIKSRELQVEAYIDQAKKSLQPLKNLPNQQRTLDTLMKIASSEWKTAMDPGSDYQVNLEAQRHWRWKREAPRLIAYFCDRRAGDFLIDRIKRATNEREKFELAAAFLNMNPQAEWKQDFLDYANSGFENIDLDYNPADLNPQDVKAAVCLIRAVGNFGSKKDMQAITKFEKCPNKTVRDVAVKTLELFDRK